MSSTETVTVHILDKDYQVACSQPEREDLLRAATELDVRMRDIRSTRTVIGVERIAVMAALNLANDLLKSSAKEQNSSSGELLLADLHRRLDKLLP